LVLVKLSEEYTLEPEVIIEKIDGNIVKTICNQSSSNTGHIAYEEFCKVVAEMDVRITHQMVKDFMLEMLENAPKEGYFIEKIPTYIVDLTEGEKFLGRKEIPLKLDWKEFNLGEILGGVITAGFEISSKKVKISFDEISDEENRTNLSGLGYFFGSYTKFLNDVKKIEDPEDLRYCSWKILFCEDCTTDEYERFKKISKHAAKDVDELEMRLKGNWNYECVTLGERLNGGKIIIDSLCHDKEKEIKRVIELTGKQRHLVSIPKVNIGYKMYDGQIKIKESNYIYSVGDEMRGGEIVIDYAKCIDHIGKYSKDGKIVVQDGEYIDSVLDGAKVLLGKNIEVGSLWFGENVERIE